MARGGARPRSAATAVLATAVLALGGLGATSCGSSGTSAGGTQSTTAPTTAPTSGPTTTAAQPPPATVTKLKPTYQVDPRDADPSVSPVHEHHQLQLDRVWLHQGRDRHQLLVFLPGSGGVTEEYGLFASTAAEDGYDVVVLAYPNNQTVANRCKMFASTGADQCFAETRGAIDFGTGVVVPGITPPGGYSSKELRVAKPDAITARLVSLLGYLADRHPSGPWGAYLTTSASSPYGGRLPATSKMVVAGSSQGGGHASFLGHRFEFARVLTFSSPADFHTSDLVSTCTAAAWQSAPSATPAARYYGFEDVHSFSWPCDRMGWRAAGYLGAQHPQVVDTAGVPGPTAPVHALVSDDDGSTFPQVANDSCGTGPHGCGIEDKTPVTTSGQPIFLPVWQFMLGVATGPASLG